MYPQSQSLAHMGWTILFLFLNALGCAFAVGCLLPFEVFSLTLFFQGEKLLSLAGYSLAFGIATFGLFDIHKALFRSFSGYRFVYERDFTFKHDDETEE